MLKICQDLTKLGGEIGLGINKCFPTMFAEWVESKGIAYPVPED